MPYRQEAEAVLAMWREVERDLREVDPASDEAAGLIEEWARLRVEHQRLSDLARRRRRPTPAPWPEDADLADTDPT